MNTTLLIGVFAIIVVAGSIGAFYTALRPAVQQVTTSEGTQAPATTTTQQQTTSTTEPESTSTAATTPTTTTVTAGEVVEPLKLRSFRDLLSNFSHIKLAIREISGSNVSTLTLEYSASAGEVIQGEGTMKVILTLTSSAGESQTLIFWLTKDFSTTLKMVVPDGTVYEGASATQLGSIILSQLSMLLMPFLETQNINYVISESPTQADIPGWVMSSSEEAVVTLGTKQYRGYSITLENINDNRSQTSLVNIKIAELKPGLWFVTHIKAARTDGIVYEYIFDEVTPYR